MSTERKLTALLHELQHARSPLAQARVLARAWRTVRELGPTDRRLLARHVGFDGAEEILEGLNRRSGGLAPAMLLRALTNARGTDSSAVAELLAAIRDPRRRDEAISLGADLASDLLADPAAEEPAEEVQATIEAPQAAEIGVIAAPEEALAALNAIEPERATEPAGEQAEPVPEPETEGDLEAESIPEVPPQPGPLTEAETAPEPEPPSPNPPDPAVDWSRWQSATESYRPAPTPRPEIRPSTSDVGTRRFEARAVMGAMGAEQSVLSQLRVLRRELSGFAGSSISTLRELVESFPDGWARRRALCALLEAGIPAETSEALELISALERELDRRWCLGILARRGELKGSRLDRALELVSSPSSKRRIRMAARS